MLEASGIRVVSPHREGIDVEAEATVRIAGITTRDRIRVTRWEPPWILEMAHLGWVKGSGYMELTPTEAGTELFWREQLIPPWGLLGRLGLWLVSPAMRRAFRRDLHALKEVVERSATRPAARAGS